MITARESELKHRMSLDRFQGIYRWYREVCTFLIFVLVALFGAPYFAVRGPQKTRELWTADEGWIHEVRLCVHHDPRTFIGLPKAWRSGK